MNETASLSDLSGRVALVTGGNGGIGRAIALGLAWLTLARLSPCWLAMKRRIVKCLLNFKPLVDQPLSSTLMLLIAPLLAQLL